jgi:hypothetical protein
MGGFIIMPTFQLTRSSGKNYSPTLFDTSRTGQKLKGAYIHTDSKEISRASYEKWEGGYTGSQQGDLINLKSLKETAIHKQRARRFYKLLFIFSK